MANLFTSQTPSITDASDGTPGITTATTVVFAVDGTVTGVRFYATATVSGAYTGALWEVTDNDVGTGTLLASKTAGVTPTGGTWNTIAFDTPVSVTAGVGYRVGIFSGAGRYVATLGFFSSGLTNGNISAPAHNGAAGPFTVFQGTFAISASLTYPTGTSGSASYFADVEFADSGVTGDAALTLPAITAAGTGTASATGSAASTLPAVTVAGVGAASASGAAAPTLPALTTTGTGSASTTGSGSLTPPALTATGTGGEPGAETFGAKPVISVSTRRPEIVVYARPSTLA